MPTIYVSPLTGSSLINALKKHGFAVEFTAAAQNLHPSVAAHPDMLMCKLGAAPESEVVFANLSILTRDYPGDARYNAICLDRYFVHRLDITAPELLKKASKHGLELINVRQGYAKCSSVVVDGKSIITADNGVASALEKLQGVEVLRVRPGFVKLTGFNTGFIGGASGRIGNDVWFNGDITAHPNWIEIKDFIESRGLGVRWFDYELEDVGSIIERI
ncbi:MAG: hypothetical protein E7430_04180 [Ruminococcaceae bacterium]|nr:hypothetical protein [Oscillospiraceae bacterium]